MIYISIHLNKINISKTSAMIPPTEVPGQPAATGFDHLNAEELKDQITVLAQWKQKAVVQLQYFQTACSIYHFCDANQVDELLRRS